jgi:RNA polymerase sigma-70 factor (ECF subfamily)
MLGAVEQAFDTPEGRMARRVIEGDASAEAELCRAFAPRIRLYGLRHLRNEAAAADLVQDVLLVMLSALRGGRVADAARIDSFVLATCRYQVWEARRTSTRREQILEGAHQELGPASPITEQVPLDSERLASCFAQLPPREQEIVYRTFYEESSADEIGAALSLSPGNVRVIRHRALARLQACMELG